MKSRRKVSLVYLDSNLTLVLGDSFLSGWRGLGFELFLLHMKGWRELEWMLLFPQVNQLLITSPQVGLWINGFS